MNTLNRYMFQIPASLLGGLMFAFLLFAPSAFAAECPPGETELLPNVRALPARDIAMLDADNMKFSSTSWNPGPGKLVLVARTPVTDPVTGQKKQPIDQRIYCSGGSYYDRSAGSAEYHEGHNHVHFNDYANYVLEPADINNPQNPRKGEKTSFCIMDTWGINTQLNGASPSAVFSWCPTQDPNFNTQGMSVGWGDTYGSNLPGQSLLVSGLPPSLYRLRHIFDPKGLIKETAEDDNESCKLVEIGGGLNGSYYVTDRGLCYPLPSEEQPQVTFFSPSVISQNTCAPVTITGVNLVPELQIALSAGTGPLPTARNITFTFDDPTTGNDIIDATVCVPKAKGGRTPQLGKDPEWDATIRSPTLPYVGSDTLLDAFTVVP